MEDKQKIKARINEKLKAVEKRLKKVRPVHRTATSVRVIGYGPFDEYEEEEYLINYHEGIGDKS